MKMEVLLQISIKYRGHQQINYENLKNLEELDTFLSAYDRLKLKTEDTNNLKDP